MRVGGELRARRPSLPAPWPPPRRFPAATRRSVARRSASPGRSAWCSRSSAASPRWRTSSMIAATAASTSASVSRLAASSAANAASNPSSRVSSRAPCQPAPSGASALRGHRAQRSIQSPTSSGRVLSAGAVDDQARGDVGDMLDLDEAVGAQAWSPVCTRSTMCRHSPMIGASSIAPCRLMTLGLDAARGEMPARDLGIFGGDADMAPASRVVACRPIPWARRPSSGNGRYRGRAAHRFPDSRIPSARRCRRRRSAPRRRRQRSRRRSCARG